MVILKAKLLALKKAEEKAQLDELRGDVQASWGDQMRSYVLNPYQMVKDLRTEYEVGQPAGRLRRRHRRLPRGRHPLARRAPTTGRRLTGVSRHPGGVNWLAVNSAPCGSRDHRLSWSSRCPRWRSTSPPSASALAAVSSRSATVKVTCQPRVERRRAGPSHADRVGEPGRRRTPDCARGCPGRSSRPGGRRSPGRRIIVAKPMSANSQPKTSLVEPADASGSAASRSLKFHAAGRVGDLGAEPVACACHSRNSHPGRVGARSPRDRPHLPARRRIDHPTACGLDRWRRPPRCRRRRRRCSTRRVGGPRSRHGRRCPRRPGRRAGRSR